MINQKVKVLLNTILILSIFYVPAISFAELGGTLVDSDITVNTIPNNPQPYENVTIELSSYATDLNRANIEWRDKTGIKLSGYGEKKYSFTATGPNISTIFNVTITPAESLTPITKSIKISPSEVEILWESVDGYTPPFYKGKSFIGQEGVIKVVAIPNTLKGNKEGATYTWKKDNSVVLNASGYNKNSYIFKNSEFNTSEQIEVSTTTVSGMFNATKKIEIPITTPKIVFYKRSPTDGVLYNNAIQNDAFINEDEMTIVAVPYFFSTNGYTDSELSYKWKINGGNINTPLNKTELTVRPESRGGSATIGLTVENLYLLFQKIGGQLTINL